MNKLSEMQFRIVICAVKLSKKIGNNCTCVGVRERNRQRHTEREAVKWRDVGETSK